MDLNFFFIGFKARDTASTTPSGHIPDDELALRKVEELALRTGATPRGVFHQPSPSRKPSSGSHWDINELSFLLVDTSQSTCPTLQETLQTVKQWA